MTMAATTTTTTTEARAVGRTEPTSRRGCLVTMVVAATKRLQPCQDAAAGDVVAAAAVAVAA